MSACGSKKPWTMAPLATTSDAIMAQTLVSGLDSVEAGRTHVTS